MNAEEMPDTGISSFFHVESAPPKHSLHLPIADLSSHDGTI
jgi:hypothetical protein